MVKDTSESYPDAQPVFIACPPVWQYMLIMANDLKGIADGIIATGGNWDYATQVEMVTFIDTFLEPLREKVEAATGWQPHE